MITTFTPNDVLRFIYNEVTPTEKKEIEIALTKDQELMDFYIETMETADALRRIRKKPSDKAVQNILMYSRSFNLNSL